MAYHLRLAIQFQLLCGIAGVNRESGTVDRDLRPRPLAGVAVVSLGDRAGVDGEGPPVPDPIIRIKTDGSTIFRIALPVSNR